MTTPVKPISELEVKSEVSENDKILILDSVSEEARLASKDELKGDKWDKGDKGDKWDKGDKGDTWNTWATWATWPQWATWPRGYKGDKWDKGDQWIQGSEWPQGNWIADITSSKVWKTTTVTITEDNGDSYSFEIEDWADGSWGTGSWDVVWPNSSTSWNVVLFDWTTWKKIKDSWKTLPTKVSDLSNDSWFITSSALSWYQTTANLKTSLTDNSDSYYPSQKAVKSAVDAKQDTISDLSDIRDWAWKWATAVQPWDIGTAAACNTWTSSWNVPVLNSSWKLDTSIVPDVHTDAVTSVNWQTGAVTWLQTQHSAITVTLAVASWSSKSITVSATGVTASNTVIVSPAPSDFADYTEAVIYCSAQASNSLTFTCYTEPANDIDVNVVILN